MARPKVTAGPLPEGSLLSDHLRPGDFVDSYSTASTLGPRAAAELATAFPAWVGGLMALRNAAVAPFGLRRGPPAEGVDRIGFFPVVTETEEEVVAGFDDRHLDFRVSILCRGGRVHFSTWVRRHNRLGRAYLAAVMPFHVLISRNALARVARAGG